MSNFLRQIVILRLLCVNSATYIQKINFKWFGNFEELICLVKILLETNDTGEFSEDQTHKMLTFRVGDIIVKWYSTTHTLQTQGSGFVIANKADESLFLKRWTARPTS